MSKSIMDISQFNRQFADKMDEITRYVEADKIRHKFSIEAANDFKHYSG